MYNLKNKKILITGASGYLGSEISFGLAKLGSHVLLHGRNEINLKKLILKLKKYRLKYTIVNFDLKNSISIENFFSNYTGPLSGIVSNAHEGNQGTIKLIDDKEFINSFEISILAANNLMKYGYNALRQSVKLYKDASFICISSMYGIVSPDLTIYKSDKLSSSPSYGAVKAGLIHWSKYAANEFGKEGIRVNSISPGPFPKNKTNSEFINELSNKTSLKRIGKPNELIGPVAFLCSNNSSFITGTNLVVDGWWTSK